MEKFEQIKRVAKEILMPERYVTEAIPWIGELGLSKDKISWIAEVRTESEKLKDENPDDKTAFDLIKLHLMAQRALKLDQFSHRREYIEKEAEEEADGIIRYILQQYAEVEGGDKGFNADRLAPAVRKIETARTFDEKMVAISLYINRVHHGGNPIGMNPFGGYPTYEWGGDERHWRGNDVYKFFTILNDL